MSRNLITILETTSHSETPAALVQSIETCIFERKMMRTASRRCMGFAVASVASFALLIPIFKSCATLFYEAGAGEFISLLFSDNAMLYWKEITSSIFESLPIVSITSVVAVTFVLILSFGFMIKDLLYIRNVRTLNV